MPLKQYSLTNRLKRTLLSRLFLSSCILILLVVVIVTFYLDSPSRAEQSSHNPPQSLTKMTADQLLVAKKKISDAQSAYKKDQADKTLQHTTLNDKKSVDNEELVNNYSNNKTTNINNVASNDESGSQMINKTNRRQIKLLHPSDKIRIAIIIDDLGYNQDIGNAFIQLPFNITYAFIPFSPYGKTLAKKTHRLNKSVMLHAPMATVGGRKWETSLTPDMSEAQIAQLLDNMLEDIQHAKGVNNHGGSLFTQTLSSMQYLASALASRNLFFVDSRTSSLSVGREAANNAGLKFNQRDVFLDNQRDEIAIATQLDKLLVMAKKYGYAIGIAHPYPETLAVLSKKLVALDDENIELVGIEALLGNIAVQH